MNTSEFIKRAKEIHNGKYDYSKVNYVNNCTKVCIICPEHGEFWQTPHDHLDGHGCSKCSGTGKLNTADFIQKARAVHGDKYDYSKVEYVNNHTQVCIICPEHGEFWQTPNSHLRGRGCKKCGIKQRSANQKQSRENFIHNARKVHGDKYDYSKVEYVNNKTKVCIICPEHGEFWMKPNSHLNGQRCPKCGRNIATIKVRSNTEDFIIKARKLHGNKYDYSKVEYVNAYTKVCIICPEHGEFWQTPNIHLNGCGCSICKSSKLERELIMAFIKCNIKFIYQANKKEFIWLNNQSLDFYLPDYNIAIECQGCQHFNKGNFGSVNYNFEKQYFADVRKNTLCNKNGVKLLYYINKSDFKKYSIYNTNNTFFAITTLINEIMKSDK